MSVKVGCVFSGSQVFAIRVYSSERIACEGLFFFCFWLYLINSVWSSQTLILANRFEVEDNEPDVEEALL